MTKTLLSAAALLVLAWILRGRFENAMLYVPDPVLTAHPGTYGLAHEELDIKARDGARVHGWFIVNAATSPVILACHGNGGNISNRLDKLLIFRRAGASVLLFDYRGYGKSRGSLSEKGVYNDAEAAYSWLTAKKGIAPERIVVYGESLGGGPATQTALDKPCAGLILDSAFTSVAEMGKIVLPWFPSALIKTRYDNIGKLARLKVPILVMHSPQDDIIPFSMGKRLFDAAPMPKRFFEMKGNHNEGFLDSEPAYGKVIADFLRSLR